MDKKETGQTEIHVEEAGGSQNETEDAKKNKTQTDSDESQSTENLLQRQLEEKQKEFADLKDTYLRFQAETENFKRRMREEKAKDIRFANERLIKELLPLYENLDRALTAPDINAQNLKQGVDMIFKEFTSVLEKEKVKAILAVGKAFDPAVHEALSQVESKDHKEQTIIHEISKGFLINDRVLCPAKVVISKKPTESVKEKKPEVKTVSTENMSGETPTGKKAKVDKPLKAKKQKYKH